MKDDSLLEILDLGKSFGNFTAVQPTRLKIAQGEFFSLLGPSGCGKTTLLRMIAGLETPSTGSLRMRGEDITQLPPYRRKTHLVFQNYALFPHLTVAENVGFGLRYLSNPPVDPAQKIREALKIVQLKDLDDRKPDSLSGGQRQRVALARALILKPEILLLDEPLAALDQNLREEMQVELKRLQQSVGITFILVTHDQEEALTMSNRIAVMNQGRIEQVDEARKVYESPRTEFVARFMGIPHVFHAQHRMEKGLTTLTSNLGLKAATTRSLPVDPGKDFLFTVRPERMQISSHPPTGENEGQLPVTIKERIYKGGEIHWITEDHGGHAYTVIQASSLEGSTPFLPGAKAWLHWKSDQMIPLTD